MNKEKELELKVKMFCATISSQRQLCDNRYFKTINSIAYDINEAFNTLNK